jgi:hypothetical protein
MIGDSQNRAQGGPQREAAGRGAQGQGEQYVKRHAKASTAGSTQGGAARIASLAFAAALLALLVFAIPAGAAEVHQFKTSFGASGSGSGQFSNNKGIAIDQSDGSVYVVDSGNYRVQKFDAAGNFVLMFGKGVNETISGDICTAASGNTCKAGTQGSGGSGFDTNNGFSNPSFVAVDPSNGDVYVADSGTKVIDKFSSAGVFISSNNGSGSGSNFGSIAGIAVDPSRNLWVYDTNAQMRKFDSSGAFLTQWNSGFGVTPVGIAVDSSINLYIVRGFPAVQRMSSSGSNLGEVDGSGTATALGLKPSSNEVYVGASAQVRHFAGGCVTPCSSIETFGSGSTISNAVGVAVRSSNSYAYVSDPGKPRVEIFEALFLPNVTTGSASNIQKTSATLNGTVNPDGVALTECKFEYGTTTGYGSTIPCAESLGSIGSGTSNVPVHADISGLTLGTLYHFRLVAKNSNGTVNGADKSFETLSPPVIKEEWAQSVGRTEATLIAKINPKGFATTYHLEYGTSAAYGQASEERSVGSDTADHTVAETLAGLQPGTTYHYRFVATNSIGTTQAPDRTFTTYAVPVLDTGCPNQAFRTGPAAYLPDCRAYEMVSPIDKNGGGIRGGPLTVPDGRAAFEQAALSGEKITYSAPYSFGDQTTNGLIPNQYIATRGPSGWSTHGINLPKEGTIFENFDAFNNFYDLEPPYEAFSEDLSTAWVKSESAVPLTPLAVAGFGNLYRRDNGSESYEALTVTTPANFTEKGLDLEFRGASADHSDQVFEVVAKLTADAPATNVRKVYDFSGGAPHLVSVLPNGAPSTEPSVVGTFDASNESGGPWIGENSRMVNAKGAVSEDGSRVYWSNNVPRLYLRVNPGQAQSALGGSGECTEAAKACTYLVSSSSPAPDVRARFWAANPQGSRALYGEGSAAGEERSGPEDLYIYNAEAKTSSLIAHQARGVLGASEDLSRIYFISKEALAPGATGGQFNLYLDDEGAMTFIAALAAGDLGRYPTPGFNGAIGANSPIPFLHDSRVTPDGRHLAFMSASKALSEAIAGYDNTDAASGEADMEVYVYEAGGDLLCASCNPSGARPRGHKIPRAYTASTSSEADTNNIWGAAWLPTFEHELNPSRLLSADGNRLFFNSFDPLLPRDTNGVQDAYEWRAQGVSGCDEADGCVSLISSGESPQESEFIDASADGSTVFFRTWQSIDPRDPGQIDIYAARTNGGYPPPAEAPPCVGNSCQSAPEPPNDPTPASASFQGIGNPVPHRTQRRCRARRHAAGRNRAGHTSKARRCRRNNRRAGR